MPRHTRRPPTREEIWAQHKARLLNPDNRLELVPQEATRLGYKHPRDATRAARRAARHLRNGRPGLPPGHILEKLLLLRAVAPS